MLILPNAVAGLRARRCQKETETNGNDREDRAEEDKIRLVI